MPFNENHLSVASNEYILAAALEFIDKVTHAADMNEVTALNKEYEPVRQEVLKRELGPEILARLGIEKDVAETSSE